MIFLGLLLAQKQFTDQCDVHHPWHKLSFSAWKQTQWGKYCSIITNKDNTNMWEKSVLCEVFEGPTNDQLTPSSIQNASIEQWVHSIIVRAQVQFWEEKESCNIETRNLSTNIDYFPQLQSCSFFHQLLILKDWLMYNKIEIEWSRSHFSWSILFEVALLQIKELLFYSHLITNSPFLWNVLFSSSLK